MDSLLALSIIAGSLQALGYFAYASQVLRKEIRPNAASWTMFAYGTTLLFFLEWDRGASLELLVVPAICAFSSVCVAIYCKSRGGKLWPEKSIDRASFLLDVGITIVYVATWVLLSRGDINQHQKEVTDLVLLVCWNVGILTAFFPLLREVYHYPQFERSLPWGIWATAYAMLVVITLIKQGGVDELLLYPFINMIVHAFVAHHARAHRRRRMHA